MFVWREIHRGEFLFLFRGSKSQEEVGEEKVLSDVISADGIDFACLRVVFITWIIRRGQERSSRSTHAAVSHGTHLRCSYDKRFIDIPI